MNSQFEIQEKHELLANEAPANEPSTQELKTPEANTTETLSQKAGQMLDSYLQRACMSQDAVVSAIEQAELRAEMSGHILALAAAHRELGSSAEEAMQAALRQFGEAEEIGQAVGHEIGKRPTLLGSPHTISMLGGILSSWVVLSSVNFVLASTNLDVIGAETQLLGFGIGCISGSVIWKRRKTIRQAALWNARFCTGMTVFLIAATFTYCCLFNSFAYNFMTVEWLRLATPALLQWIIVTGVAGACSGALTGLWCHFLRRTLTGTQIQAV